MGIECVTIELSLLHGGQKDGGSERGDQVLNIGLVDIKEGLELVKVHLVGALSSEEGENGGFTSLGGGQKGGWRSAGDLTGRNARLESRERGMVCAEYLFAGLGVVRRCERVQVSGGEVLGCECL